MSDRGLFDGITYSPRRDGARLAGQLASVRDLMADGRWRTLRAITDAVGGSEAGVSARLRDMRKLAHGGHTVNKRRVGDPASGLWEYQVILRSD